MGLDMYLELRKYVSKLDEENNQLADYNDIKLATFGDETLDELGRYSGMSVKLTVGYWRKANAIHNWFIENCTDDGVDDCREMRVSKDQLYELDTIVERLLEHRSTSLAEELLPTKSGFFFGDTEYNEWYWEDLVHTRSILKKILGFMDNLPETERWRYDLFYQASW